ncbi:MAG: enoyl-CoA hydratase/isomerase family protein [Gemmatimonadota bacterium]|nr:enoyl-CoA hydratase/isomerase family protein [Gemmatimonadota bacterium]
MEPLLDVIDHGAIRELRLAHPPVNALRPELLSSLRESVEAAPGEDIRALVISGSPGIFSAGLDVRYMLEGGETAALSVFQELRALMRSLATSTVPTVAAITGHSPAGGAVMAICCDYRVMAEGKFKIGLNEVQVGLSVPPIIHGTLTRLVGLRNAERMVVSGALLSPQEALDVGLVDRLVAPDQVLPSALEWCEDLLARPSQAMLRTRAVARADLVALYDSPERVFSDDFTAAWSSDETQATMRGLMARLMEKG